MSHPALPRIESGLAAPHAALLQGDMEAMHAALASLLDTLAEVTRAGLVPRLERPAQPAPDPAHAERFVYELLARCKAAGCRVFPYAGTLLGPERDGRLLPDDKDADLAVWLEDFSLTLRLFQQLGLQRATDVPPFANVATFVDPRSGITVDLFGLHRNAMSHRIEGGAWLHGRPPAHQRFMTIPWFELAARATPFGEVWWPADAAIVLRALYGEEWRTPQPEWDSQISNPSIALNLAWRAWALKNLCNCWLTGDLARTQRLLAQVAARAGEDAQLRAWREALEQGRR